MPSANVFVAGFELDMYWEWERFAVELDGYEFHSGRSSFERDRRRQKDLKLAGIEMVRITARRVRAEPTT
jgi:very-short-patch-repair endonuclease